MPKADAERLRTVRTFPQLVAYLRDELGWPVETDDFEDLTYEYDPDELGIDPKNAAKIDPPIRQLRPLTSKQPWGVFFVKFEPKRLPVVALRRILGQLALRKRDSANPAEQKRWRQHDLLFISAIGEGDERRINFAHFSHDPERGTADQPILRVLGWDAAQTALRLQHVDNELHQKLTWPDDEDDVDGWRQQWASAFTLRHREVITTAKQLSIRLADLAQAIRRAVNEALSVESSRGPLRRMQTAFREGLIHDLTDDDFADMFAQTISYGLLSTAISRFAGDHEPLALTVENMVDLVPETNPFLRELFSTLIRLGGHVDGINYDELGIQDVVDLLNAARMGDVLRDFGAKNPDEDPVIHFYELFLKEYDPEKRVKRGVFYTPKPVVSYIVRSVHELLQTEFGLKDGLADTTTWGEMLEKHPDFKLPEIEVVDPQTHRRESKPIDLATPFVQILDPATGTATFLVEVIDVIYATIRAKWKAEGHGDLWINQKWNEYVPKHLLPRLHGYELMMAPYAIAHMKIGLKLFETGYTFGDASGGERARIYLTNTLEPPQDFSDTFEQMAPALAHEAQAVNDVKRHQRFTVVIGNPPYSGESANKIDWVEQDVKDTYQRVNGNLLKEKGKKNWLLDDYVKFLRFSHRAVTATGTGLIGHIINNAFQDNPTFRGLRHSLLTDFQSIRILDLHGSGKRRDSSSESGRDDNVFDILQGVCILILSRSSGSVGKPAVSRGDLWGRREDKYQTLSSVGIDAAARVDLQPKEELWYFIDLDLANEIEWGAYISLLDAMPINGNGMISAKDHFAYAFTSCEFRNNLQIFLDDSLDDSEVAKALHIKDNSMWSLKDGRLRLRREIKSAYPCEVAYRPFDTKHSLFHRDIIFNLRLPVTRHVIGGNNLVLLTTRMTKGSEWKHCFVSRLVSDCALLSNQTSTNAFAFPLLQKRDDGALQGSEYEPNFSPVLLKEFGGESRIAPESVFQYFYAVLYSPEYRSRYAQFLQIEFPRIPLPASLDLVRALATIGEELIKTHLLESPQLDKPITKFEGPSNPQVEKASYADQTVWLDKAQTCGFVGVPEEVWNFHIGGYQVCEKWLKDRQAKGGKNPRPGRKLTAEDITHYGKIVAAIHHTIRLMKEIDEVIDAHGGWPDAFITDPEKLEAIKHPKA